MKRGVVDFGEGVMLHEILAAENPEGACPQIRSLPPSREIAWSHRTLFTTARCWERGARTRVDPGAALRLRRVEALDAHADEVVWVDGFEEARRVVDPRGEPRRVAHLTARLVAQLPAQDGGVVPVLHAREPGERRAHSGKGSEGERRERRTAEGGV
jgi:hypothetical protein